MAWKLPSMIIMKLANTTQPVQPDGSGELL